MLSREYIGAIEQQALRSGGGGCSTMFNQVVLDPPVECEGAMDGSLDAMGTCELYLLVYFVFSFRCDSEKRGMMS